MRKHMHIKSILVSLLAVCTFTLASAQAGELKVAYVDMNTAMQNTAEYQMGMKRLKELSDRKVKELEALKDKITKAEKDLMSQSLAMSQENQAQKQQKLKEMGKRFQRMQQDAQEELSAMKNRMVMSSGAKFQKVIQDYGKTHHYDMIVPKPIFLYVDPKHDITADITKLLDAKK